LAKFENAWWFQPGTFASGCFRTARMVVAFAVARPWLNVTRDMALAANQFDNNALQFYYFGPPMSGTGRRGENTMSEIANLLQQKAGLSPEKAQQVEKIVVEHIMARVPPQFQGMLSSVLGTGANPAEGTPAAEGSGGLGGMLGSVTGMFGENKT
jgi:hypothetical protein